MKKQILKNKIAKFQFNPTKETAQVFDRYDNNLFSLDKNEALWLAERILKSFNYKII